MTTYQFPTKLKVTFAYLF